jgi:hypothetical protein
MTQTTERARWGRIVAGIGAVAGVALTLTALFDWFEGKVTTPPPKRIAADLVRAELQPVRETLGEYLVDQGQPTAPLTREQRREPGLVFLIEVRLRGGRDEEMPLRWQLYRGSGRRVPGDLYRQTPFGFIPGNQDHQRTARLWLPLPPTTGRYFVRFTVLNPKGETVDELTTKPFRFMPPQLRTGGRPSATSPSRS